jgi:hypothetical protein
VTEAPDMEFHRRSGVSNLRTFKDGVRVLRTFSHEPARANLERGRKTKAGRGGGIILEDQAQGAAL